MSTNGIDRCGELQSQLAAYALGEADPDAELLTHLARCADCWRTLHAYAQIARTLPFTAPQAEPAPELRARILAAATAQAPAEAVTPPPSRSRSWSGRLPRWRSAPALRWGLAFAMLLALLGWNVVLQSQLNAQTRQLDRLTAQVATSRQNWQTMTRVLNTSDLRAYELSGSSATGRFWASPQTNVACLVAEGLPDPGAGNVYRVWLIQNGTPVAVGSFVPQGGSGYVLLRIDQPLTAYQALDITIEPRDGNQTRSGQEVLRTTLEVSALPESASGFDTIPLTSYDDYIH